MVYVCVYFKVSRRCAQTANCRQQKRRLVAALVVGSQRLAFVNRCSPPTGYKVHSHFSSTTTLSRWVRTATSIIKRKWPPIKATKT